MLCACGEGKGVWEEDVVCMWGGERTCGGGGGCRFRVVVGGRMEGGEGEALTAKNQYLVLVL